MKINYKKLAIHILIPLLLGALVGILTNPGNFYKEIIKPSFAPPGIIFPIVWSILYILMGISSYYISESDNLKKDNALLIYYISLVFNLLWSFFFFTFKAYLFSFIWIIALIVLVIITIFKYYNINKLSAYLQIPYLLWIIFASILNYAVYLLN